MVDKHRFDVYETSYTDKMERENCGREKLNEVSQFWHLYLIFYEKIRRHELVNSNAPDFHRFAAALSRIRFLSVPCTHCLYAPFSWKDREDTSQYISDMLRKIVCITHMRLVREIQGPPLLVWLFNVETKVLQNILKNNKASDGFHLLAPV